MTGRDIKKYQKNANTTATNEVYYNIIKFIVDISATIYFFSYIKKNDLKYWGRLPRKVIATITESHAHAKPSRLDQIKLIKETKSHVNAKVSIM